MTIRKSKDSNFDVNAFLNDIDHQEEVKQNAAELDIQVDELRNICLELAEYYQKLEKAKQSIDQYCLMATKIQMDGRSAALLITQEINKAVEETKHITINANLSTTALQSISAFGQAFAESEKAVLEAHAEKQKSLLQKHHYEFCNMLDKKQGVWLSPTICKVLLWIFCPCVVITVSVISIAISVALGKK